MTSDKVPLKFLVISDLHGHIEQLRKLENLISSNEFSAIAICGDLVASGSLETGRRILKLLSNAGIPVLGVPGNMDPPGMPDILNEFNANLHGCGKILFGIGFIGAGFRSNLKALLEKAFKDITHPTRATVAVTHIPPYGTKVDLAWGTMHIGSSEITEFIRKQQLEALLCGHVHESTGIDKLNNTLICNPGPLFSGHYAVLNVGEQIEAELHRLK